MQSLKQVSWFGALAFMVVCLFESLFWSSQHSLGIDNVLFPFALTYAGITSWENKVWRPLFLSFIAIVGWVMLSDIIEYATLRPRSIGMSMRWLKWGVIIFTLGNHAKDWLTTDRLKIGLKIIFLALVGVNLILFLNPLGLGEKLAYFYAPKQEVILGNYHEFGGFRLSGTMQNPNNNAIVFTLFLLYFLLMSARENFKYVILCFFMVFLTQSRTGMAASILAIVFYVLQFVSLRKHMLKMLSGIVALIIALFLFRSTNLVSLFTGEAFRSNSWLDRLGHYAVFFQGTFNEQFFGRGIVLNPVQQVGFHLDSEYLSILLQMGYVGMVLWGTLMFFIVRIIKNLSGEFKFGWQLVALILLFSLTNTVFLNPEVTTILAVLIGVWAFTERRDKLENQS